MTATNQSSQSSVRTPRDATSAPLRIGAVSYLNSKPLIEGLQKSEVGRLVLDVPSRLAESLARGEMDVALIPSVEAIRSEGGYEIVSDACVAAHGPVRSVKVYFRVPPGAVRTLALDDGSRTSAALTQVLLGHKYGVFPKTVPLPLGKTTRDATADAILLIGDRAMYPVDEQFEEVWDLGEQWHEWTGLPFVFAVWAARRDIRPLTSHPSTLNSAVAALSSARDRGIANVAEIAERESRRLGMERESVLDYLTQNLHFTLGPAETSALKLFAQLAAELGLAPKGNQLAFYQRTSHERAGGGRPDARSDGGNGSAGDGPKGRRLVAAR